MSDFIHLTNKTEYSLSEGALPIARLSELCQAFKMPAVGITDTNNMFGALEFSEKVSSVGVQPIIGCNLKIKTRKNYLHVFPHSVKISAFLFSIKIYNIICTLNKFMRFIEVVHRL